MSTRTGYNITDQHAPYFVTFTAVGWVDIFSRKACKEIIVDALRYCIKHNGLILYAYVIMESHLHLIVGAREGSTGLSAIIRDFKRHTSKAIIKWTAPSNYKESRRTWLRIVFEYHAKFNKRNQRFQVWQQRSHPIILHSPKFTWQKLNYIHNNPVKAGIVDEAAAFCYSSARNYAARFDFVLPVSIIDFGFTEGFVLVD